MTTKNEPFYNIKAESSACERIKITDDDDETSLTIPLNEIGQFESIKVYNQTYVDNQQKRIEELEKENAELKSECRTCVYTDSPCILSDYPSKNGVCSHYKNVFDFIAELKREIDDAEIKCIKGECPRLKTLENKQLIKAKEIISKLLTRLHNFTYTGLNCEECKEAKQFIKEIGE